MNRCIAFIKNDLRLMLKQWPAVTMMYIGLPLAFMFIMSFSMSQVTDPSSSTLEINVTVDNQDQGELGKAFETTLTSGLFKDTFTVKEDQNLVVEIPEKFSEDLEHQVIILKTRGNVSQSEVSFLEAFIKDWHQTIVEEKQLMEAAESKKRGLFPKIQQALGRINQDISKDMLVRQRIEHEKQVSTKIYYVVVAIIYAMIIAMSGTTGYILKDDLKGVFKRLELMPLKEWQKLIFSQISNTIMITLTSIITIFIAKYALVTNTINEWRLLPWIIIFTMLFISVGQLLLSTMSKMFVQVMLQVITMAFVFLGFIPTGDMIGGHIGEILKTNIFEQYLIQPMTHVLVGKVPANEMMILISVVVSIVLVNMVTLWMNKRRERF